MSLVDNGLVIVVWIGQNASNEIVSKLFGVGSVGQVDNNIVSNSFSLLFPPLSLLSPYIIA